MKSVAFIALIIFMHCLLNGIWQGKYLHTILLTVSLTMNSIIWGRINTLLSFLNPSSESETTQLGGRNPIKIFFLSCESLQRVCLYDQNHMCIVKALEVWNASVNQLACRARPSFNSECQLQSNLLQALFFTYAHKCWVCSGMMCEGQNSRVPAPLEILG